MGAGQTLNDGGERGFALLRDLSQALTRLTRIPVPDAGSFADDEGDGRGRIVWAYPVIGALIGAAGGIAYALLYAAGLPALLAAIVALCCLVAVSGAAPENSLVRCAERLAEAGTLGGATATGPLGTVGIITLVLSLAARAGAMAAIAEPMAVAAALVAAGTLSQAAVVVSMHFVPPAADEAVIDYEFEDDEGTEVPGARPASGTMMAAALIAIVIAALVLPFGTGGAIVAACVGGGAVTALAWREAGGYTKDMLGTAQQIAEIAVLVVLAAVAGQGDG